MPVPFCRYLDKPPVFTDATPTQIGLCMPHTKHFVLFESHNRVIENDFFSIFLVHILFPNSVLVNDNIPAIFLFRRGKLPQSLLDNFLLNLLIIELWVRQVILCVCSWENPADCLFSLYNHFLGSQFCKQISFYLFSNV